MEKMKIIGIIVKAVLSYLYKYRPYMTTWVVIFIVGGIYESLKQMSIEPLIAFILVLLTPIAIKRILLAISRFGGEINPGDEKLLRVAPRGRFINYVVDYLKKK